MSPSLRHRSLNLAQSALLIGGMAVLAWILVSSIAGAALTLAIVLGSVLGLLMAPKLPKNMLLSAYGARRLTGDAFPQGASMLAELSRRAGLPRAPDLYYLPSRSPNAFAIGAPSDSVVCVSDGLLRLLDRDEFEGVLAHEISHIANRDLWIMGLADAMARVVALASWVGLFLLLLNLPLVLFGAAAAPWHVPLLLMLSPTVMALLQLALSRTREFDADRGAADLTGDPEALVSALLKLERRAGWFWENIFMPGRRSPEPSLLRTHPPTEERVKRLRALGGAPRPASSADVLRVPRMQKAPPPRVGIFGLYR